MSVEQSSTAVESKRALLKRIWEDKNVFNEDGWAKNINPRVSLLSFDGTKVTFQYTVDARDCNLMGSLHGGAIATLADNLTTYAALLDDRNFRAGVSVSLEVDYMSAPRPGEVITIECVPEKTGKYLSFSSATFVNSKGEMVAKARHVKFLGTGPNAKL